MTEMTIGACAPHRQPTSLTCGVRGRRAILPIAGSLIAALVLALPGIAHADEWSGSDDFETNSGGWSFTDSGPGIGGFSSTNPYSGSRSAFLHQPGEGWSSVGRQWYVKPVAQGYWTRCFVYFGVDPGPGASRVNIEVINPNTFNYLALREWTVDSSQDYLSFWTRWDAAPSGPSTVLVRASLIGNSGGPAASAWVDDFQYRCFYN